MPKPSLPSWLPYILPLALFLILPSIAKALHLPYPTGYMLSTAIVLAAELALQQCGCYPELRLPLRLAPAMIALGAILCAVWIGVDRATPHLPGIFGTREAFDPWTRIADAKMRDLFIAVRFLGLVVAAPLAEELFYRAFLLRFLIDPSDFRSVEIGRYEPLSCAGAVLLMASSHPEWLAAALFSLAMNVLVYRTKSVGLCVLAHGFTNLALGIYVIVTHSWVYW